MQVEIVIEKNIPIPAPMQHRRHKRFGYGFWKKLLSGMSVGDSFLVDHISHASLQSKINMVKPEDFEFTTRTLENGIRVWRTA